MFYSRTCLSLGILLTCAAFAFGGVRQHPYEDHNPEYEEDPVNEDYPPSTCTGCITQADLTAALVPYLKTGDLVNTFAAHITEILGNSAVAYALKKFVQANAPACTNCPVGTNPPAVGLLLCQYQSKINSPISTTYNTISNWEKVYCNDYFKSINSAGEFVNTGGVTREVAFDFAVRCDCKYSVATQRRYMIARRKRETMSPYDQSASAAVESTVYDPVDYFRRKRNSNYLTSSCGNDNCVGRTATVEIYKGTYELKEVQVSNLCYVVQSFRIITKVGVGEKVFLKLKNANLLPTEKCQWTLTAAYVG